MQDSKYSDYCIYHYCGINPAKRSNAAYLICAYQVVILKRSASEAWSRFKTLDFLAFRDASYGPCFYECTILDCLRGLEKGIELKWFNLAAFDLKSYEFKEKVENGDMNWIIPQKLLAFSSPNDNSPNSDLYQIFSVAEYCQAFNTEKIKTVIRLNNKTYEEKQFTESGIKHFDLYFPDGSCPSNEIIERFIQIVESENSGIAVHCKAGLGRTGTLIGCYAIKKFRFPARDFIGWCRICRPGSILGPQQQFLIEYEKKILGNNELICYSAWDRFKAVYGDQGQGQRLIKAKRSFYGMDEAERDNGFIHRTPLVRSRSIYGDIN